MKKTAAADVVIFGGGIAGLWTLNRLRQAGLSAILFESSTLGGGQTHKAQGIIHGGMKYALQGFLTNEANAMSDMPTIWRNCLKNEGEVDLSRVPVLSDHHYLWSPSKFSAKLAGLFASAALVSKVTVLNKKDYPAIFSHPSFKGEVFALDEIVIDVPALVRELVKANEDAIFKIEPLCDKELTFNAEGKLLSATVYLAGKSIEVSAQYFIFAAGSGNEIITKKLPNKNIAMQRRPLHMVLMQTPFDLPVYAHCLGFGPRPRVTITTHYTQDGHPVWYIGGQLAEEGLNRDSKAQIQATLKELKSLFPWLDFSLAKFATFIIDRAEAKQANGLKPESSVIKTIENIFITWPTKLAFAPKLANDVMQELTKKHITPELFDIRELHASPPPPLATPIWEEIFCKNVA